MCKFSTVKYATSCGWHPFYLAFAFMFLFEQVDLSHIYGETLDRQLKLRLLKDGKLKYQVSNSL